MHYGAQLELNRENGVTLIMVTHDTAMKKYAHRVLHMLDGKIHRVEAIPQADRHAKDAELVQCLIDDVSPTAVDNSPEYREELREPSYYPWLQMAKS
jgi:ABC-type methionine transport system ATPase subunit